MSARIAPTAGPADPPSSRPGAGLWPGPVHAYAFDAAEGVQRVQVPLGHDQQITADTVVHWAFYSDDAAAVASPWASLAVGIDIVFDDGTRLSDMSALRDRYGFALDAETQFAARWSMPEQWNADTVALTPFAGRRVRAVELVLGSSTLAGLDVTATGCAQLRFAEEPLHPATPAERVDTRRGSHAGPRFSRGNTVPIVAVPHGFAFLIPATDAASTSWPYRGPLHDEPAGRRFEALQISHQPSPWIGDRGVLQFTPFRGIPSPRRSDRRLFIRPGTEQAHPHRYAAQLTDADGGGAIGVQATATNAVAVLRVAATGQVGIVIDRPDDIGGLSIETTAEGRVGLTGWVAEGDAQWGNAPRMYFAGETSAPARGTVPAGADHPHVTGAVVGDGMLELRIATSFLSVGQARRTLAGEAPWTTTFDELRDAARHAWDEVCGRISIAASSDPHRALADEELRATIAGDLYRLHLYPNEASENTGTADEPDWRFADVFAPPAAHGDESTGAPVADGHLVVNNGYWDTYRTVWPLLSLLDAPRAGALLDGQLTQARRGGWMARWSAPGYVDCMVGTSSDQIFADAQAWGVPGFDEREAFATGWRNACEQSSDPRAGRAGVGVARFTGSVAAEMREGLSWSLEAVISDAALGRFAARLAAQGDADAARMDAFARYFANRSRAYRRLFDRGSGFFRGRGRDGRFSSEPFDPRMWGGDYVETNAWGMSVAPVHDGAGLAALYGGRAGLRAHLDRLFAEPETADPAFGGSYGTVIHEQREARAQRSGMCALSNQPAHHIPAMYTHTDQPWRAGPLIRSLAERLFAGSHIGQGYPGDEDNGEMSAWWLWALIGLYPLELASGMLVVGDPLVDDVTVDGAGGRRLRVVSHRETPNAHALRGVRIDGEPWPRAAVPVDRLRGTVRIDLDFGAVPDPSLWPPQAATAWSPDLCTPEQALGAAAVFDDRAGEAASHPLRPGDAVGQDFGGSQRVSDLTVTTVEPAPAGAFVLESSDDLSGWREVPLTDAAALPGDRTTPFQLAAPQAARYWRVRAVVPLVLRQVELFDLVEDDPRA